MKQKTSSPTPNVAGPAVGARHIRYTRDHAPYPVPGIHDRGGPTTAPRPTRPKTQREIDRELEEFEAEEKRSIYCDVARFEVLMPHECGDGSIGLSSLQRGAFDKWLREHDPGDLTFSVDHEPAPARWTSLHVSGGRLWGRAVVDEGFEDLVELARVVPGCSVAGAIVRSTDRGERDGLPVVNIHEADLLDAGLASVAPADPECRVRSCGGGPGTVELERQRHRQLTELGVIRPAGNRSAWRPRFGGLKS